MQVACRAHWVPGVSKQLCDGATRRNWGRCDRVNWGKTIKEKLNLEDTQPHELDDSTWFVQATLTS